VNIRLADVRDGGGTTDGFCAPLVETTQSTAQIPKRGDGFSTMGISPRSKIGTTISAHAQSLRPGAGYDVKGS
jgi:hypothetical protein